MSHGSAIATMQGLTRLGFIKMIRALKFVNVLDFIGMGQECYKKYKWVTTYADLVQQEFLHQNSARMLADAEAAADQYMNSLGGHDVFPYDPELKDFAGFHETPEDLSTGDTANRLEVGPEDRLAVRNDRKRFQSRLAEA